jgi:hypothetical protein
LVKWLRCAVVHSKKVKNNGNTGNQDMFAVITDDRS